VWLAKLVFAAGRRSPVKVDRDRFAQIEGFGSKG
jgi:hypothetical protein